MCGSSPKYETTEVAAAPEAPEASAADNQGTPEVETTSARTNKRKGRSSLKINLNGSGGSSKSTGLNIPNG